MAERGPIDLLWSAADFASGRERASGSGIPILFPFPGRIAGTTFHWEGREYSIPPGDGRGNAIHGFVLDRSWRVLEQAANKLTGQFQASRDDPELLRCWPADFRITVSYELSGTRLDSRITVENPDDKPLPCGLGTHPYFRLPMGGHSAAECVVKLPVSQRWELQDMLPTGKLLPVENAAALQAGTKFADMSFDDVFAALRFAGEWCQAEINDPDHGGRLTLAFDAAFRECVVYTPPHREAICIEPYTCVAGGFSLPEQQIDTGIRLLAPGDSFHARTSLRFDAASSH